MTDYNIKIIEIIMEHHKKNNKHISYSNATKLANEYVNYQLRVEREFKKNIRLSEVNDE